MRLKKPKVSLYKTLKPVKGKPRRKVWMLRWIGADGRRYGEIIGECDTMTKRQAETKQREWQGKIDNELMPAERPEAMTLQAFAKYHDELVRSELAPRSLVASDRAFKWAIKALGGKVLIASLTAHHVAKVRNAMTDAGLEPPTVQKTLSYLRAAFNRAKLSKLVNSNPFNGFKVKGGMRAKDAVIRTHEEIAKLKAAAFDPWWRAAISLWFTGLCEEEAFALKWSDVDLDAGTVTVRPCKAGTFEVAGKTYPILRWTAKTENRYREVAVSDDTVAALRKLKTQSDGSIYVFLSLERLEQIATKRAANNRRECASLVNNALRDWKAFQRRVLGNDAPVCTIHDCRKTYCTLMAEAGMPIQDLAQQVGDTEAVLLRFYTKARQEVANKYRNVMNHPAALKLASAG